MFGRLFLNKDTKATPVELDRAGEGEHCMAFALLHEPMVKYLTHKDGHSFPKCGINFARGA